MKVEFTLRITSSEHKSLKLLCKQVGRSQTDVIREALRQYMAENLTIQSSS